MENKFSPFSTSLQATIDFALQSDSDDERPPKRPRFIPERSDHFRDLDEVDFKRRFRLSKRCALIVLEKIEHHLEYPSDKNNSVSPMNQLLLTLRYYATGGSQLSSGDFSGVSEPTANRIIHRVSWHLAALNNEVICFPRNEREKQETIADFYSIIRFPRTIGALDCTFIQIRSPGGEQAEYFRSRKGYFAFNCQAIVNSRLEFMDLVARWPGSVSDQTIFDNCTQKAKFEAGTYGDAVLVADSGYASKRYMMRPLGNPVTPAENLYNEAQIRTRNPVERAFGVWKRRFPVLALGINVHHRKAMIIILACGVLHNILLRNGDTSPPDDPAVILPKPWETLIADGQIQHEPNIHEGPLTDPHRQELIRNYFGTLHTLYNA